MYCKMDHILLVCAQRGEGTGLLVLCAYVRVRFECGVAAPSFAPTRCQPRPSPRVRSRRQAQAHHRPPPRRALRVRSPPSLALRRERRRRPPGRTGRRPSRPSRGAPASVRLIFRAAGAFVRASAFSQHRSSLHALPAVARPGLVAAVRRRARVGLALVRAGRRAAELRVLALSRDGRRVRERRAARGI